MHNVFQQDAVLVLNRHWQAINTRSVEAAFTMLAGGAATALADLQPVRWEDWVKLPIREGDDCVHTPNCAIRVPRVIIAVNFDRIVLRKKTFNGQALRERDGGTCQYTGKKLAPGEGNIDHVVPRSRGGKTSWDNCVLAHRDVNSRKADKTPAEAGLRLLRKPAAPPVLPPAQLIVPRYPEWEPFVRGQRAG